jgi:NitT/TauT family transport system ATP-binding protein
VKAVSVVFEGLLALLRGIPFISLVPLVVRVFGLAETGKIFLVAWATAGVCWVIVHQAAQNVPQQLVWRAMSLGATRSRWILRILLPACREQILAGLRASLSLGLIVIAVAEMSGVYERSSGNWWSEGLGYRLFRTLDQSRDDLMIAAILCFALLGITVDQTFVGLSVLTQQVAFRLRQKRIAGLVRLAQQISGEDQSEWPRPPALSLRDVRAGYGGSTIIARLSLTVPAGETITVIGPSGSGKTTLIRAIGHFTGGDFWVGGQIDAGGTIATKPGPWVGVVLQDAPVFDHMTVWDNLVFGNRFRDLPREEALRTGWHLLTEFGLAEHPTQRAGTLSGGQRQRLAFAMVLANRPQVLLLDEPFGALDAITRRQLQHFYWQHVHGRVTAIFVTHDIEEALTIGDQVRIGVAPDGEILTIDKHGLSLDEWERQDGFGALRSRLIAGLEGSAPSTPVV